MLPSMQTAFHDRGFSVFIQRSVETTCEKQNKRVEAYSSLLQLKGK